MGWFDKKSWRLRRKIKDLQAELLEAEKQGKYLVEQGLFFAELEDMGEMTMMVFGSSDQFSSSEDSVIRAFFDRNGFTVETLKLDKTKSNLAEVEIIPPEEMTRAVGRSMKASGYRLIDDSENERAPSKEQKIYPLSTLVRAMIILFAEQAHQIIATTRIKMNKEGNRLLHWMPKIRETLEKKVEPWAVEECRPAFQDAYNQFYGRIGHGGEVSPGKSALKSSAPASSPEKLILTDKIPSLAFPAKDETHPGSMPPPMPAPRPLSTPPTFQPYRPQPTPPARSSSTELEDRTESLGTFQASARQPDDTPPIPSEQLPNASQESQQELVEAMKARDLAEATAAMYKSLVKSNSNRCVKNSEALLQQVHEYFSAAATCVLVKVPNGHGLTIHAQAGRKLTWGEGGGEGYPVSSTVLGDCVRKRTVVTNQDSGADPSQSMVMHSIEATAAAPIVQGDEIVGILYIDRRGSMRPFTDEDAKALARMALVFQEFPDLTLGLID